MAESSQYETMLERLGAFLGSQGARKIQISDEGGGFLLVSWQSDRGARQQRCFRESDLMRLDPHAFVRRGTTGSGHAPLLAPLGRELDRVGMDVARIDEKTDVFQVSGTITGKYFNKRFEHCNLVVDDETLDEPGAPEVQAPSAPPVPPAPRFAPLLRRMRLRP